MEVVQKKGLKSTLSLSGRAAGFFDATYRVIIGGDWAAPSKPRCKSGMVATGIWLLSGCPGRAVDGVGDTPPPSRRLAPSFSGNLPALRDWDAAFFVFSPCDWMVGVVIRDASQTDSSY